VAVNVVKFYNLGNEKKLIKIQLSQKRKQNYTVEYFNETDNVKFACTAHFQKDFVLRQ